VGVAIVSTVAVPRRTALSGWPRSRAASRPPSRRRSPFAVLGLEAEPAVAPAD
jgi:hypothetical protein